MGVKVRNMGGHRAAFGAKCSDGAKKCSGDVLVSGRNNCYAASFSSCLHYHIYICIFVWQTMKTAEFEWDEKKNRENQRKHGVSFETAQFTFADPNRVISEDIEHSYDEQRYHCTGRVGYGILTVSFTYRDDKIRIINAGPWRKGKKLYEERNKIH